MLTTAKFPYRKIIYLLNTAMSEFPWVQIVPLLAPDKILYFFAEPIAIERGDGTKYCTIC